MMRILHVAAEIYPLVKTGGLAGQGFFHLGQQIFAAVEEFDRVDQFEDFDPRAHYALTVGVGELTTEERVARGGSGLDGIDLDLSDDD